MVSIINKGFIYLKITILEDSIILKYDIKKTKFINIPIKKFKTSFFTNAIIIKSINTIGARDNSYSEAIGMIRYFIDKLSIRGKDYTMFDDDKYFDLVENKRNNINNGNTSVFG